MSDVSPCINCGRPAELPQQRYCPACGQATPARRIDWAFLRHELEHSILHADHGILYTLRHLMLRPGHLLRDYLDGRRNRHVKPFLLVMMMAALVLLLNRYVVGQGPFPTIPAEVIPADAVAAPVLMATNRVMEWINDHFAIFTLLMIPPAALLSRVAFAGFSRVNTPEWLVIWAFLTAQAYVIWALFTIPTRWWPTANELAQAVMTLYAAASLVQFFRPRPAWKSLPRILLYYALYTLLLVAITLGAGFLWGLRSG